VLANIDCAIYPVLRITPQNQGQIADLDSQRFSEINLAFDAHTMPMGEKPEMGW